MPRLRQQFSLAAAQESSQNRKTVASGRLSQIACAATNCGATDHAGAMMSEQLVLYTAAQLGAHANRSTRWGTYVIQQNLVPSVRVGPRFRGVTWETMERCRQHPPVPDYPKRDRRKKA